MSVGVDCTRKLKRWRKRIVIASRKYMGTASILIDSHPQDFRNNLTDLSRILADICTESHVSAHLKRCLAEACSRQCHERHIAYLRLAPEEPPTPSNSAVTEGDKAESGSPLSCEATWHLAFKSTISSEPKLTWLKVVSTMLVKSSTFTSSTVRPLVNTGSSDISSFSIKAEARVETATSITQTSRKRRASSSPPEPPLKLQKTTIGQAQIQGSFNHERRNGMEICPEYLTGQEHDNAQHAIIRISDNSGCDLRIFYLPRSFHTEEAQKTTLGAAIGHKLKRKPQKGSGSLHWIVTTARLVAEAVVRFDLRDKDESLENCIIFHEASASTLHSKSAPSMEVKIERANSSVSSEPDQLIDNGTQAHRGSRKHVLLNLGIVLLQLGTHRDLIDDLDAPPPGPEDKQFYIIRNAGKAAKGVNETYANAVRNCARLFGDKGTTAEDNFLDSFLRTVLQPLRDCEKALCTHGHLL